jgi:outer membrane protein OmpA-like peptidoglycan-associated protein
MASVQQESGIQSSFTDLMTSLAVIFILMFCATWNDARQEGTSKRGVILVDLKKELEQFIKRDGVEVKEDPKDPLSLVILVPEGLMQFKVGDDQIPESGARFLGSFMPILAKATIKFKDDINSIVVEGHADTSGKDKDNLPLSQRRSMSVVMKSLGVLEGNERDIFLILLSASGRGSVDPYMDNGVVNMDKSRRVVFKIRIRSFEQRGKEIVENIKGEPKQ